MTTSKRSIAAIAILLVAVFFGTSCDPNGGRTTETATPQVSAVRAMMQYADVGTASDDTYKPSSFKADDGTVIEFGTFRTAANGNIVEADLTLTMPNGQKLEFVMKPASEEQGEVVTVGDETVNPDTLPVAMTADERRAFLLFMMSAEEIQDDIRESVEEAVEYLEDHALSDGWVDVNHRGVQGSVNLHIDEFDDGRPEYEIIGWDVVFTNLILEDSWARGVSGFHVFSERGEKETSTIDVKIEAYSDDGLVLNDVIIDGTVIEDEKWDEDSFEFDGLISGTFSLRSGESTAVCFEGSVDAVEDRYLHFPEYELTIDGKNCAIGREDKPFVR